MATVNPGEGWVRREGQEQLVADGKIGTGDGVEQAKDVQASLSPS